MGVFLTGERENGRTELKLGAKTKILPEWRETPRAGERKWLGGGGSLQQGREGDWLREGEGGEEVGEDGFSVAVGVGDE